MLSIKEIRAKLGDRNLTKVAKNVGLSYNTVFYFCREEAKEPSYKTVKALSDYLEGEGK